MYLSDLWDLRSLTKRLYGQRIQPVCEAYGLTRMEMDILLFLANNPAFDTARDIVERNQFTKSHVSASVAELERRGYLRGEFREGNRKTVHLALCPGAEPAVRAGQAAQREVLTAMFMGFTEEERMRMGQTISRIVSNIRTAL